MLRLSRIITLVFAALTLFLSNVYPAAKIPRIGVLLLSDHGGAPIKAFRKGLNELGYVEGNNIAIEYRSAKGIPERIPHLAAELIDKKVSLILTVVLHRPELSGKQTLQFQSFWLSVATQLRQDWRRV